MACQGKQSLHVLLALFVLLSSCKANPRSKTEAEALLKWKESLPDQPTLKSWVAHTNSSASSPCKWRGITCSNEGSITEINLAYAGLRGNLQNLDFSSFPNLLHLDLSVNKLTGTIPTNIGTLSKLQYLDLSTNSLNGSLPLSLANLTHVYQLDFSLNNISGGLDRRLFPDGTSLSKTGLLSLKIFVLQYTKLGGRIPEEIGNLKYLVVLALDWNYFCGPIPPSIGNLSDLTTLILNQNEFSGQIPVSFGTLKLTHLYLLMNRLSGSVPEEIVNLSSLVTLHLAQNNFAGHLPQQVCQGGQLVNFSAAFNNFTGPIPVSLKNCRTLYRVRLEHNQLTGYIDQDFGVYPNLNYIDLSYNRLQGKLSPNWAECLNLTVLRVAGNLISGKIPNEIVQLSKMGYLDLSSNQLSGEIPVEIGKLSKLLKLILKDNKLSGEVPAGIGGLSNLESLDLSINMLGGPIPGQIGDCWKLQSLSLSKNHLNGTIPNQIGNLRALQDLDLSFNSLMGGIPLQLGSLPVLEYLNLSNNNLNGLVPTSLGSMMSLISINLSNNNLEGPLPDGKIFRSSTTGDFSNNKDLCSGIKGLQPCNASVKNKSGGNMKSKLAIIFVASVVGAISLLITFVGIFLYLERKHSKNMVKVENTSNSKNPFLIWYFDGKTVYKDIVEASESFDDKYCIGVGGTAKVYKVEIPGAQVFAVKKPRSMAEGTESEIIKSFTSELAALTEIRHRNIVKLFGFCFQDVHSFLVYEFMERGSLADMLCSEEGAKELDWPTRIRVVKSVAYALSYMHHDCVPPIIHRDISSKNILLSSDLVAYVSDFGTARFLKPDSSNWTTIAGTYGYLAPACVIKLILKDNKLSGEVPAGIGGLSNLESLDLSINMLGGSIPDQIGDCWKLQSLSLSQNYLNGTIPYQIGNLRALQDLDFSFNSLMGGIPPKIGRLLVLEYLNLSNNNLNGSVPTSLGNMMSLISFNLSKNNLEGPLPEGRIFRSATPEAFSNNKDLCGEFQGLRPCYALAIKKGGEKTKSKLIIIFVASFVGALSLSITSVQIFLFLKKKHSRNMVKDESTSESSKMC